MQVAPLLVEGKPHLPFQLQIEYTSQDGSRCMRVITQAKPITTNRDVAEKGKTTHALRLERSSRKSKGSHSIDHPPR